MGDSAVQGPGQNFNLHENWPPSPPSKSFFRRVSTAAGKGRARASPTIACHWQLFNTRRLFFPRQKSARCCRCLTVAFNGQDNFRTLLQPNVFSRTHCQEVGPQFSSKSLLQRYAAANCQIVVNCPVPSQSRREGFAVVVQLVDV